MNTPHIPVPRPSRPHIPHDYGVPATTEGLLPWSYVEERLTGALNYWVCSVRPDGHPHATPVWGCYLDGILYFEGSPQTRRGRNIAANPAVVVHLESGSEVVIIEGEAHELVDPPRSLTEPLAAAECEKYHSLGYEPAPDTWDEGGLYRVEMQRAFAWTKFPADTTRWMFK